MITIDGGQGHASLAKRMKQEFAFDPTQDYNKWKSEIREKFLELVGIPSIEANACPLRMEIESDEMMDGYRRIRFVFESEIDTFVPCYLLIPDTGKESYPVAIMLQGHSTGFHNSIGVVKYEKDVDYQPRGCFGLQAVEHGFAALCIEQRAMGERKPAYPKFNCGFAVTNAFLLGRTVIGERIWDISRAIDLLGNFPQCDLDKILITGNSGGGTASYYAACFDERIKISVPSCSFCGYESSIMSVLHCSCNFIPSALKYFEMQDLACLIAPRKVSVVTGAEDNIFPLEGVQASFETLKAIFEKAGVPENANLLVTPKGHWWCVDIVWPEIERLTKEWF